MNPKPSIWKQIFWTKNLNPICLVPCKMAIRKLNFIYVLNFYLSPPETTFFYKTLIDAIVHYSILQLPQYKATYKIRYWNLVHTGPSEYTMFFLSLLNLLIVVSGVIAAHKDHKVLPLFSVWQKSQEGRVCVSVVVRNLCLPKQESLGSKSQRHEVENTFWREKTKVMLKQ